MSSIIPCPLCVAGSGKSKGHSGAHRLFTNTERKRRRQQVNRANYSKRCRHKAKNSISITPCVNDLDKSRTKIISQLQSNVRQEGYWVPQYDTNGKLKRKIFIQLYFTEFHKHYNPYCKTSLSLNKLSRTALFERHWVEAWSEFDCRRHHKKLLRAIPGMSTILGGKEWSYTKYSTKEAVNIYKYFLDICLQKHPVDIKEIVKQCKKCGSDISYLEHLIFEWNYDFNEYACYHCVDKKDFPKNKYTRKNYTVDEIIQMIRDPTKWWKEKKIELLNHFGSWCPLSDVIYAKEVCLED